MRALTCLKLRVGSFNCDLSMHALTSPNLLIYFQQVNKFISPPHFELKDFTQSGYAIISEKRLHVLA